MKWRVSTKPSTSCYKTSSSDSAPHQPKTCKTLFWHISPTNPLHHLYPPLLPAGRPEFNRDQASGKAFLIFCWTYIHLCLCPEAFEDDLVKVVWAMSYMKTECAGHWAICEFEHKANTRRLHFLDWLDFKEEFWKDFIPLDLEAAAINVLEKTTYFQGKQTVNNYLDQFQDLIYDSGYTDPKTVVVKFCWGLDCWISMALTGMAFRRPSDMDPEGWFRLTVWMDQNHAVDEAFHISDQQPYIPTPAVNCPPMVFWPALAAPAHALLTPTRPQVTPSWWT